MESGIGVMMAILGALVAFVYMRSRPLGYKYGSWFPPFLGTTKPRSREIAMSPSPIGSRPIVSGGKRSSVLEVM